MSKLMIRIKCGKCGKDETLTQKESDKMNWNENGTVYCFCGNEIPYKGRCARGMSFAAFVKLED